MAITITIPAQYTSSGDKMRWIQRKKEEVRIIFNRVGAWYRDGGVTLNQYNNLLPQIVKNRYAYTPQLSEANWKNFVEWSENIFVALHGLNDTVLNDMYNDTTLSGTIDETIQDN